MFANQFRYVIRKLVHSPMFTVVALLTLALAIADPMPRISAVCSRNTPGQSLDQ